MVTEKDFVYDYEVFPNFIGVTFIPRLYNKTLKEAYIALDKKYLELRRDSNYDVTPILEDKKKLLYALGGRQFRIWVNPKDPKDYINELPQLVAFFKQHKTIMGYNSNNYDENMHDILMFNAKYVDSKGWHTREHKHITTLLFDKSVACIEYGKGYRKLLGFNNKYYRQYTGYDIQKILYLDKSFTALKQVAIALKWHRIQDLPYPYDHPIHKHQIVHVDDYNVNDTLITLALAEDQIAELELREDISNHFGINCRNMSRSSIGKAIAVDRYARFSGLNKRDFEELRTQRWRVKCINIVSDDIKFTTPVLKNLLNKIKNQTIVVGSKKAEDKFEHFVKFDGVIYTLAKGGLHSQDRATIYDIFGRDLGWIIRDADVDSYYPNGILRFRVCPAHLKEIAFRAVVGDTKDTRVDAKHKAKDLFKALKQISDPVVYAATKAEAKKQQTIADGLKIAINRMYGALNDANDPFYDPKCTYQTTINLQLALLMLIERLVEHGISVISANTDGIVCRFKPEQEKTYKECCDWWMNYMKFNLEFTDYERYLRNDVNNYIAIKKGFKESYDKLSDKSDKKAIAELEDMYIKGKGRFISEVVFNRGFNAPVVAMALNKHLVYGVHYTETIKNHINTSEDAIYDYCLSQKTDKAFRTLYNTIKDGKIVTEELQKSNRYYVCEKRMGGDIYKKRKEPKTIKSKKGIRVVFEETRLVAGWNTYLFNDYVKLEDYGIDFNYYNRRCSAILMGKNSKTDGVESDQYMNDMFAGMIDEISLYDTKETIEVTAIKSSERRDMEIYSPNVSNTIWSMYGYTSEEEYIADMQSSDDYEGDNDDDEAIFADNAWIDRTINDNGDLPF